MRCIHFDGENCMAFIGPTRLSYKPTEEEQTSLCNNREFRSCPRLMALIEHLKAMGKTTP
jgi:hypothetical protein